MFFASHFVFSWKSPLEALTGPALVLAYLLMMLAVGGGVLKITQNMQRWVIAACLVAYIAGLFGFPAMAASDHSRDSAKQTFYRVATRDLKLEGFRHFAVDAERKTVTVTVGSFGCSFTFGLDLMYGPTQGSRVLWRPVLSGKSIGGQGVPDGWPTEAVFTPASLISLRSACNP